MGYCDFNVGLFKEFISMKEKIKPELADDWEMIPMKHVSLGGFQLKSNKAKQTIADINLRKFLTFCKDQDLVIKGLKLQGTFIVGNNRAIYTEEMYNTWKDKYDIRTESIISMKDAKIGYLYKTPCGRDVVYLGYRYVASIKQTAFRINDYSEYSKITKKYFVAETTNYNKKLEYSPSEFKDKLSKKVKFAITEKEANDLLTQWYNRNMRVVCFEKNKPAKDVKFGIIEYNSIPKECYYSYGENGSLLYRDDKGVLFASSGGSSIHYYGPEIKELSINDKKELPSYKQEEIMKAYKISQEVAPGFYPTYRGYIFNENTLIGENRWSSYNDRWYNHSMRANGLYRIGIVNKKEEE